MYSNQQEVGLPLKIKDEGVTLIHNTNSINFRGDGVTGSLDGTGGVEEDIPGGGMESDTLATVTARGATTATESTFSGGLITTQVKAHSSAGIALKSNNGTSIALLGAGSGANATFYGGVNFEYSGVYSINTGLRLAYRSSGLASFDWENGEFYGSDGVSVALKINSAGNGIETDTVYDSGGLASVGVADRQLYSSGGTMFVDYDNAVLSIDNAQRLGWNYNGLKVSSVDSSSGETALVLFNGATYGNARGVQALDIQNRRSAVTQVASGQYSVAYGNLVTASVQASVAVGYNVNVAGELSEGGVGFGSSVTVYGRRSVGVGVGVTCGTAGGGSPAVAFGYGVAATSSSCGVFGFSFTNNTQNSIVLAVDGNNYQRFIANGNWNYVMNGVVVATLNSTGLGIGPTAPSYQLDIQSSASSRIARIKSTLSGGTADLILDSGSIANPSLYLYRGGGANWRIYSNNSNNLAFYSFGSAPNADSLVINASTHAATFTGTVTNAGMTVNSTAPTITLQKSGVTKYTISSSSLDLFSISAGTGKNYNLDLAGRHALNAGTTTATLFAVNTYATTDRVLLLKHIASGTGAFIEAVDSGNTTIWSVSSGGVADLKGLVVNANSLRLTTAKTPSSASDTGTTGDIAWDADYIYACVATNTWKRAALSTW